METRNSIYQSVEARLDEIGQQMDQMAHKAPSTSADTEACLRSRLSSLRSRLAEVRARQHEKMEADDRASDAALAEIGQELDAMDVDLAAWPT